MTGPTHPSDATGERVVLRFDVADDERTFTLTIDGTRAGPYQLDPDALLRSLHAGVTSALSREVGGLMVREALSGDGRHGAIELFAGRPRCWFCSLPIETGQPFVEPPELPGRFAHLLCVEVTPEGVPEHVVFTPDDRVGGPACDFCGEPAGAWLYPCASFDLPQWGSGSAGDWLACASCARLVEAGDREGLRRVALAGSGSGDGSLGEQALVRAFLGDLHGGFFALHGPRRPGPVASSPGR